MTKTVIITCFGYPGNSKYAFNPNYVRSDLRRVLAFAINRVKCHIDKIIVLTDLNWDLRVAQDIYRSYQDEVIGYLRELGWKTPKGFRAGSSPSEWLRNVCELASRDLKCRDLQDRITRKIIPVLNTETIIEFASLFTSFRMVCGMQDYYDQIKRALSNVGNQLLFYYTGHGVRFINQWGKIEGLALVIQQRNSKPEYLKVELVQKLFLGLPDTLRGLVVFDCCHASGVVQMPHSLTSGEIVTELTPRKGIVVLASCREDQTCGFYDQKYGSLFTYFLISALNKGKTNLRDIIPRIESKILEYRKSHHKPDQNITVSSNQPYLEEIPDWSSLS